MSLLKTEPVRVFGSIQVVLVAALGLLSAFNVWTPTDAQLAAISALYVAATALAIMFIRGAVTPNTNLPPR